MPSFYIFIIPNFLRGISMGLISVLAMIALDLGYGSSTVSSIVTITYLANFAGSFLYLVLSKHLNEQILCMLGALCIGAVVFAPNRSDFAFLVVCFITLSGKIIVDYAVPSRIYKLTSIETAGMYHAWRQLITNAGTALSAAGSGFIIQNGMSHFLLIITFAAQIICSLFYLLYNRDRTHM
jgi:predicted MFS family arabinose efflux permease